MLRGVFASSFFLFARNFKASVSGYFSQAIPFPCHFNAGPLFGTFSPASFLFVNALMINRDEHTQKLQN